MKKRFILTIFRNICLLLIFLTLCGNAQAVENTKGQVVLKVGCVDINNFLQIQDKTVTGYGADYLREISTYTDWQYEYVHGTWSQCLQWLREGKIDLLLPAEYTAERSKDFIFSKHECCTDYVMLLIDEQHKGIYYEDFDNFHGMNVGMIQDNSLNSYFAAYAKRKGFTYQARYYGTSRELSAALAAKEVDAIVTGNLDIRPKCKIIAKFDYMPAYFMMHKKNQALMQKLDEALYNIQVDKPYFRAQLYEKYYALLGEHSKVFTRTEAEYIAQAPVLRVVTDSENHPFAWYDENQQQYQGIDIDIFKKIAAASGLKVDIIRTATLRDSWNMMREGKADILLGVYIDDVLADNYNVDSTHVYMTENSSAVSRRGEGLALGEKRTVAISSSLIGTIRYLQANYPQWDLKQYPNQDACLKAVANGQADLTFVGILYMQTWSVLDKYPNLTVMPGVSISLPLAFGVSKNASPLLKNILNKSILSITKDDIQQKIINNTITQKERFSLKNFIKYNPVSFSFFIVVISLIISLYIFIFYRSHVQNQYNKQLAEKNLELQQANKATDVFFSQLSHDMRTPMNAILGFTELGLDSKNISELLDYFTKIKTSGQYLLRLINDSLEVSKLNNGKVSLKPEPYTLAQLAIVLEDILQEKAQRKSISLTLDMSYLAEESLLLDKMCVQQVLVNLLNNSLKFTPQGGTVKLLTSIEEVQEKKVLCFKIIDNGCGMSEEFFKHKLYHPFEQEQKEGNLIEEGTGLGLSIVKRLIERMDGTILCDSRINGGTTFTVLLPLTFTQEKSVLPTASVGNYSFIGKRVLICEDHPLNLEIAVKLLKKTGLEVDTAMNGQAGVDKIKTTPECYYDAILMDVRMPVLDGISATKAIRALPREDTKAIPIIAMTANHSSEDVEQCLAAGMNVYLGKPVEPSKLFSTLQILFK